MRETTVAEEFWEQRYRSQERMFSGRVNPVLADVVGQLPAGAALDLGCGEGGDAIWLAGRGWRVTAVDVSATALDRVALAAAAAGVTDRVRTERHDLSRSFPTGAFDLVSAQFLQSPVEFPRAEVLRAATRAVAPGGLLLVVEHGSAPPWSWDQDPDHRFPTPAELLAVLELGAGWRTEVLDSLRRTARGPDGATAVVADTVVAVRRARP